MLLKLFTYAVLTTLFILFGVFVAICAYLYRLHCRYDHLPGPKRTSFFFGNVGEFQSLTGKAVSLPSTMLRLKNEYGPVFLLFFAHRQVVVTCDPATIKALLTTDIHQKPNFKFLYKLYGVRFMGRGLVSEYDHSKWYIHRRIFNPSFRRKFLMELMDYFNNSSDKLVLRLRRDADTNKALPLMDPICRTTLDVIAKAGFGMTQELILEDSAFVQSVDLCLEGIHRSFIKPLDWIYPSHWKFRREVKESVQCLRDTGKELITKCREKQEKGEQLPNNILSNIMKYLEISGDDFDTESMLDEFATFFVAGNETTSSVLGFTLLELGKHPEVMKKMRDEVDAIIGDKNIVEYQDVVKLKYSLLVLKETLRLFPPAPGVVRETAHEIECCGYKLPTGTHIQLSMVLAGRMEEYFKNANNFDPERFLRNEDSPLYAYFPFSLGSRSCIGQQFAMLEARVILAKLIQNFDIKLDPNQSFDFADTATLKPKGGCWNFIYTRRATSNTSGYDVETIS